MKEIIITDKNQIKEIIKTIEDINQLVKTIYNSNDFYYFYKGKVVSYSSTQFPSLVVCDITKECKAYNFFKDKIFSIEGKRFFEMLKNNKKDSFNKITVNDLGIIFSNSLDDFKFFFLVGELELVLQHKKEYLSKFNETYFPDGLDLEDKYKEILLNEKNNFHRFVIDIDNEKVFIKDDVYENKNNNPIIYLSKKFILGIKSKKSKDKITYNDVKFYLYQQEDNDSLYSYCIETFNKTFNLKQYYIAINSKL